MKRGYHEYMSALPQSRVFAFDFDGVIGEYYGFKGEDNLGNPNPEVVGAMRTLKARGHKIIIFSTHSDKLLREYCEEKDIPFDYINENPEKSGANKGKPVANVYVDDRGYCYRGQKSAELVDDLEKFQPHWKTESTPSLKGTLSTLSQKAKTYLVSTVVLLIGITAGVIFAQMR